MAIHKLTIQLTADETAKVNRLLAGESEFPVGLTVLSRSAEFPDDPHGAEISVRVCRPHPMIYCEVYDQDGDIVAGGGGPIHAVYQEFDFPLEWDEYTVQVQPATQKEG